MNDFNIDYIKEFILSHPDSKVYLGVDSQRVRKKRVRFAVVVAVHYNNNNGAKIFHNITYEKITDAKLSRPFMRMMTEVNKVTELYTLLEDVLIDRDFEIHLDISANEKHGSNVAHGYAKGVVWGTVGIEPTFKPNSWCASTCADKYSK